MGLWLNYGVYNINLIDGKAYSKNGSLRSIVNQLPDIKLETERVEFLDQEELNRQQKQKEIQRAEEAASKEKLFAQIKPYNDSYTKRRRDCIQKQNIIEKNIGVDFDSHDNYKVTDVKKDSLAQVSKIDTKYRLIAINNIPILELQNKALESFLKIDQLAEQANQIFGNIDNPDIEKLTEITNCYIEEIMELNKNYIIYYEDYKRDPIFNRSGYYIDNLPSGTKLQFEKNTKGKQIEITVP